jgi:hypothetical protein
MATAIIPKSTFRLEGIDNISVGFGEVPCVSLPGSRKAWGLPGGNVTYNPEVAKSFATKLDKVIRTNVKCVSPRVMKTIH